MTKEVVELTMGRIRRTWTSRSSQGAIEDRLTKDTFERAKRRLLLCFANQADDAKPTSHSFDWFLSYLEARAVSVWEALVVPVIDDVGSLPLSIASKAKLFDFIANVAEASSQCEDISLEDVVETLVKKDEYRESIGLPRFLRTGDSGLDAHLVLHVVGWITALCDPDTTQDPDSFTVVDDGSRSRRRTLLHVPTVRHLSTKAEARNRPIYELLDRFGELLPKPDSLLNESDLDRCDIENACITTAYVSFHHLRNTLKCEIRWTNTLNQHLEYDRRRKVLHVFAMPSLCSLVLQMGGGSVLTTLLEQSRNSRKQANTAYKEADFRVYLLEILLSYRVIFGCHKKSRKQAREILDVKKGDGRFGLNCDPLLRVLCTGENTCQQVESLFSELGVDGVGDYVSLEEFQFLGKRFMRLESISKSQNPSGWRRFWHDRRNKKEWFAMWVVIILGGGTLVLQALQMVFQIWQPPIGGNN